MRRKIPYRATARANHDVYHMSRHIIVLPGYYTIVDIDATEIHKIPSQKTVKNAITVCYPKVRTLISNATKLRVVIFLRQMGQDPEYDAGAAPLPLPG